MHPRLLLLSALLVTPAVGAALRDFPPPWDREAAHANGWIYDDLSAGLAEARETGKPLMVVLRCPP